MNKIILKKVNASDIKALTTGIKYSYKEREQLKSLGVLNEQIDKLEEIIEEIYLNEDLFLSYDKFTNNILVERTEESEFNNDENYTSFGVILPNDNLLKMDLNVYADAINDELMNLYDGNYEDCGEFWEITTVEK